MTAVAGFRCKNGVVLCADRQMTGPDRLKFNDSKLRSTRTPFWDVVFVFAGSVGIAEEAIGKISTILDEYLFADLDQSIVFSAVEETLTEMGRFNTYLGFQLFIAVAPIDGLSFLIKFDGQAIHLVAGASYLGLGESPLVRFLSEMLYSTKLAVEDGAHVAAYLITKAAKYIDGCGGAIDVVILRDFKGTCQPIKSDVIAQWKYRMERQEKVLREIFIRRAFSLSQRDSPAAYRQLDNPLQRGRTRSERLR
jgi:20S proteasome alpha/beta subunit